MDGDLSRRAFAFVANLFLASLAVARGLTARPCFARFKPGRLLNRFRDKAAQEGRVELLEFFN